MSDADRTPGREPRSVAASLLPNSRQDEASHFELGTQTGHDAQGL